MYEPLRRRALALLKIPPEPRPPLGDPASLRVFRAGRNYYRLRLAGWSVAQAVALAGIVFWAVILIDVENAIRTERPSAAASPPATAVAAQPGDPATAANVSTERNQRLEK